jgi:DNA-binding CsgD family transcriptional regulator
MKQILLFTYILLFSFVCIGTASIIYLHTCLKMKLTKYLSILFAIMVFSLTRILLFYYFKTIDYSLIIPEFLDVAMGIIITLSVYLIIYKILYELNNPDNLSIRLSTFLIIAFQLGRTVLFYLGKSELTNLLQPAFICFISAYLLFVGLLLGRGERSDWNPAIKKMIKNLSTVTVIFAPLSACIYVALYIMEIKNVVSLDFIFMGLWGAVVSRVLILYLSRIGTIPISGVANESFFSRYKISNREKEVLELILEGYTNKEIGEKLFISYTTARTHVSHIFEKTNVNSRMELVTKVLSSVNM